MFLKKTIQVIFIKKLKLTCIQDLYYNETCPNMENLMINIAYIQVSRKSIMIFLTCRSLADFIYNQKYRNY